MAKFVEEEGIEIGVIFDVKNGLWRAKKELFSGFKNEFWVVILEGF